MKRTYVDALNLPKFYIVLGGWRKISAFMDVMVDIAMLLHVSGFAYIKPSKKIPNRFGLHFF